MPLRVGIDLVRAATVAASSPSTATPTCERVYTPRRSPTADGRPAAARRALRRQGGDDEGAGAGADAAVPWPSIEVRPQRRPARRRSACTDRPPRWPQQAGLTAFALCFTHEDEYAAAVVVGT